MEVELLRQMMVERETRIELVKQKLAFAEDKQQELRSELEQVKEQRLNESIDQQGERLECQHNHTEATKQLEQLTRDLNQQMASLQKYVVMVQQQQDKNQQMQQPADSSFVMQMQAQLCKAMHSQGIIDHQLRLANQHADGLVKQLREALVQVEEERSKVELEFMNSLVKEDSETRDIENGFKERLAEIHKEIAQLEDDLEEKSKGSDDEESENDEENDEDDEEDAEAKQELMNMLHEQKQKIADLEKQNAKQLKQISSLKRRIENPDASTEFFSPSEEMGMSYDESESEDETSDHADDDHYPTPALPNVAMGQEKAEPASVEPGDIDVPVEEEPQVDAGNNDGDDTSAMEREKAEPVSVEPGNTDVPVEEEPQVDAGNNNGDDGNLDEDGDDNEQVQEEDLVDDQDDNDDAHAQEVDEPNDEEES